MTSSFSFMRSGLYDLAGGSERKQPINEHFADFNKLPEKRPGSNDFGLGSRLWPAIGEHPRLGGKNKTANGKNLNSAARSNEKGSDSGGLGSQAVEIESESLYLVITALKGQLLSVEREIQCTQVTGPDHDLVAALDGLLRRSGQRVLHDLLAVRGDADPRILARFE